MRNLKHTHRFLPKHWERNLAIMSYVIQGLSAVEIGRIMDLPPHTVRGVSSRFFQYWHVEYCRKNELVPNYSRVRRDPERWFNYLAEAHAKGGLY